MDEKKDLEVKVVEEVKIVKTKYNWLIGKNPNFSEADLSQYLNLAKHLLGNKPVGYSITIKTEICPLEIV